MGFLLKIIGLLLFLIGLYGVIITIPELVFNLALDQFNPLITLGIIESGTPSSIVDLILSIALIGIGIIFIKKEGKPKIVPR